MTLIGVCHLVRAVNGMEPFTRFLASYQQYPPGHAHELLILYKGFETPAATRAYDLILAGHPHKTLCVADKGFDIDAYFTAVRHFDYDYFCFLNSFSVILDADWLAKFMAAMRQEKTGLVGATGSWESSYTHFMERYYPQGGRPLYKQPLDFARKLRQRIDYPPFPNPHVRTNAFLISRLEMLRLRFQPLRAKADAYRFESGRSSMTRQILNAGLEARLVGRDGVGYASTAWADSNTFRQSRQENLLVADNQTRIYEASDLQTRQVLARDSWSDQARPAI